MTGKPVWPEAGAWVATHRHRKGGAYRMVARAVLEADRSDVVIYDDAEGNIWVRSAAEFHDGRFQAIARVPRRSALRRVLGWFADA